MPDTEEFEKFIWQVFEKHGDHTHHTSTRKNDTVPSGYTLSESDNVTVDKWLAEHNKTCTFYDDGTQVGNPCGAIGGRLTYSFTPTGLGLITQVTCACSEKLDLTDVDNW